MQSITISDIPANDPIPRRNLINHLKSDEFFDVDNFPQATFNILKTKLLSGDSLQIEGQLTIKQITKPLTLYAHNVGGSFKAHFHIDGLSWNIAYSENWIGKTIIDREIEFWVNIKVR